MSTITHIQFCPRDWLSGCHTLTAAERGVYITLVMMMYDRAGPVPEDQSRLARACGLPTTGFARALQSLIEAEKIERTEDGLFNRRVRSEIANVMAKSQVARAKAERRWGKSETKSKAEECRGNAAAMLTSNQEPIRDNLEHVELEDRARVPDRQPIVIDESQEPFRTRIAVAKLFEAAKSLPPDTSRVSIWLERGYTGREIEAVVADKLSRGRIPTSLSYFDAALADVRKIAPAPAAPAEKTIPEAAWRGWVEAWHRSGGHQWPPRESGVGPPPDKQNTRVPVGILAEFGLSTAPKQEREAA